MDWLSTDDRSSSTIKASQSCPYGVDPIAGESKLSTRIKNGLRVELTRSSFIPQDSFYKRLNAEKQKLAHANDLDLDHPDAIDVDLFVKVSKCLGIC